MNKQIRNFIFGTFQESFGFIQPYLTNYWKFSQNLSLEKEKKEQGDPQYNFDVKIDKIFVKNIKKHKMTGKIFSEESGFWEFGEKKFRLVYDPFCNSSLASIGILNSATGISVFDYDYNLITSAILDYQTGIMGIIEDKKVNFYQVQNKKRLDFSQFKKFSDKLEESFVVISMEKLKYRSNFSKLEEMVKKAGKLFSASGHICWLRLAMGNVQVYTDPIWGEKLYEMFACSLAQKAGCKVTNLEGEDFDAGKYLKIFEENQSFVYHLLACRSEKLHKNLLEIMNNNFL